MLTEEASHMSIICTSIALFLQAATTFDPHMDDEDRFEKKDTLVA
jgi:hypothetical protein